MSGGDVIVVGGGHNGLAAAALLAGGGRRVALVERLPVLGGLAAGDEFHPGLRSGGLLHDTTGVRPQVAAALGLPATAEPPPVFAPQLPGEGPGLLLHRDPERAAEEIAAHVPADAERYREHRAFLDRIAPFARRLFDNEPPALAGGVSTMWPLASRGLALRALGRRTMLELLRVGPMCLADWLNESFEGDLLKVTLAAPALAGTRAGPWSPGTAANLLRLEALAGSAVEGGPPALIGALESAARRRGVEIRLESEVTRIRTAAGAVEGVELAGGGQLDAPVVLSSCDPKRTILDLLGATAVGPKLGHQIGKLRSSGTTAKVDLALREPLRFACRPGLEIEHACLGCATIDDLERAFDAVKYRQCSGAPLLDVHAPAPSAVSILVHFAPHDLEGGWTDARRETLGDLVISTLARYAPGVETIIEARRVLTPADIEARYGVTGGHIHHVEHALDQMITRPAPSCARYATPVEGLYLCGSGSHPGGGLTCGPGALAAAAVLRRKATVPT